MINCAALECSNIKCQCTLFSTCTAAMLQTSSYHAAANQLCALYNHHCKLHAKLQETIITEARIKGQRYFLSARCVPRDTVTDSDGTRASTTDWTGAAYSDSECKAYLVQGLPYASVKSTLVAARAWQVRNGFSYGY
jgi:hypothetical protein